MQMSPVRDRRPVAPEVLPSVPISTSHEWGRPDTVARIIRALRERAAALRGDLGASALEWAIIAAVVVVAASVIGGVIYNVVDDKTAQLEQCANQPVGSPGCAP